jgi:hypothetical protein
MVDLPTFIAAAAMQVNTLGQQPDWHISDEIPG